MSTVRWQRLEGALIGILALIAALSVREMPWSALVLIGLSPDLAMAGYALGPRLGAALYNLVHLCAFGGLMAAARIVLGSPFWGSAGLIILAHAGLDRALGYGLKEVTGFSHTHLGRIGR